MTKITEIFADTNTVVEREATAEEIAQMEADAIAYEEAKTNQEQAEADKIAARAAVLTKLGLTAEEVAALLS
jgi:hypothetical protein